MSLPFAYSILTICLLAVACAGWMARCEGSHSGVAGGCLRLPYHLLTLSLPFAYYLLHVQDGEQDVMDLVFPEHVMESPPRRELIFIFRRGFLSRFSGGS